MSIRKRTWTTRKGKREAWIVDYSDQHRKRRHKTFDKKGDATNFAATTRVQIGEGTHVADSTSVTVQKAGELWLESCKAAGLERNTLQTYRQHLDHHIVLSRIGRVKLSKLSAPVIRDFQDWLRTDKEPPKEANIKVPRSEAMIRAITRSLGSILGDAQERGLVVRNAVRELNSRRRQRSHQDRHNGKLKVGVDIPTPAEVKALLGAAEGRWRPFLLVAVFTGLRSSELRGLRWDDVDLKAGELHVRQRADNKNNMGDPKSAAGERTVPLPPTVLNELREWKLKCPKQDGKLWLVFPNGKGNVERHGNNVRRGLKPTMIAAGLTSPVLDELGIPKRDDQGRPIVKAKYTGLHTLRHFFASWCINRKEQGGLGLPVKVVQERLGHASIVMTMDTYGHLFPRGDDLAELAAAEQLLLG